MRRFAGSGSSVCVCAGGVSFKTRTCLSHVCCAKHIKYPINSKYIVNHPHIAHFIQCCSINAVCKSWYSTLSPSNASFVASTFYVCVCVCVYLIFLWWRWIAFLFFSIEVSLYLCHAWVYICFRWQLGDKILATILSCIHHHDHHYCRQAVL